MEENPSKIRPVLKEMAIGEKKSFPIERLKSVRTQASELSAIMDRRFTTRTDRVARVIEIGHLS